MRAGIVAIFFFVALLALGHYVAAPFFCKGGLALPTLDPRAYCGADLHLNRSGSMLLYFGSIAIAFVFGALAGLTVRRAPQAQAKVDDKSAAKPDAFEQILIAEEKKEEKKQEASKEKSEGEKKEAKAEEKPEEKKEPAATPPVVAHPSALPAQASETKPAEQKAAEPKAAEAPAPAAAPVATAEPVANTIDAAAAAEAAIAAAIFGSPDDAKKPATPEAPKQEPAVEPSTLAKAEAITVGLAVAKSAARGPFDGTNAELLELFRDLKKQEGVNSIAQAQRLLDESTLAALGKGIDPKQHLSEIAHLVLAEDPDLKSGVVRGVVVHIAARLKELGVAQFPAPTKGAA